MWEPKTNLALWYEKELKRRGHRATKIQIAVAEAAASLSGPTIAQVQREVGGYLGIGGPSVFPVRANLERLVEWGAVRKDREPCAGHRGGVPYRYYVVLEGCSEWEDD